MTECTNPARPCHEHDPHNEWIIEVGMGTPWTVHVGWLVGALVIVFIVSLWFN